MEFSGEGCGLLEFEGWLFFAGRSPKPLKPAQVPQEASSVEASCVISVEHEERGEEHPRSSKIP